MGAHPEVETREIRVTLLGMRLLTIAIALTLLSGCLFAPPNSSSSHTRVVYLTIDDEGSNYSITNAATGPFDLIVGGTSITATIAPNQRVRTITISGTDADVLIGSSTTVSGTVTISGTNAVLHLPPSSPIVVHTTGAGAMVFYDSSAG